MPSIFDEYKPLRNGVRSFELYDALYVCWSLSNHSHLRAPLASGIEIDTKARQSNDRLLFQLFVINDWELEFLISEIILSAPERIIDKKSSLSKQRDRNKLVNHIRKIRDTIESNIKSPSEIFLEFNRKSHQQFPWQNSYNYTYLYRYYKIFNYGNLANLVRTEFGLSTFDIFKIGISLLLYFRSSFSLDPQFTFNIGLATPIEIKKFLEKFSRSINDLKNLISESRKFDNTLIYQFNPLRTFPIISDKIIVCPLLVLLYWRFTSGLYYAICNKNNFDNDFGIAFQNYLIEVIDKCNTNATIQRHPEMKYGNPEKSTADIMIEDNDSILFIECKTKRMVLGAKKEIIDTLDLEIDFDILSSAFYQLYKTVDEYKNNNYPHMPVNKNKKLYVMVVTLEDWYIGYNNFLYDKLRENILDRFISDNKRANIIIEVPYQFFSSEEFERTMQVISKIGLTNYFEKFKNENGFDAFREFEYNDLFSGEIKALFLPANNEAKD